MARSVCTGEGARSCPSRHVYVWRVVGAVFRTRDTRTRKRGRCSWGKIPSACLEAVRGQAEVRCQASALLQDWSSWILREVCVARAKTFPCLPVVLWNTYGFCVPLSPSVVQLPTLFVCFLAVFLVLLNCNRVASRATDF